MEPRFEVQLKIRKPVREVFDDNCGGWMHMMCCLKAYLEYGINLRAGGAR